MYGNMRFFLYFLAIQTDSQIEVINVQLDIVNGKAILHFTTL
jgi:hypothetical protein